MGFPLSVSTLRSSCGDVFAVLFRVSKAGRRRISAITTAGVSVVGIDKACQADILCAGLGG